MLKIFPKYEQINPKEIIFILHKNADNLLYINSIKVINKKSYRWNILNISNDSAHKYQLKMLETNLIHK